MNFLSWFGSLLSSVADVVSSWENPVINGISWLEGLFGKGAQDLNNATQIISIVDQNLAAISVAIVQEGGTVEAIINTMKNINPADVTASLTAIQAEFVKIDAVWVAQRNAILSAVQEISKQVTVITNTGI